MLMTLGEFLKKAREEKGFNLAEAAYQTKIREHYLFALENNQLEKLPSRTQGKGYLRIYAQFLSLDEEIVISAWAHPEKLVVEKNIDLVQEEIPTLAELAEGQDKESEKQFEGISIEPELSALEDKIYHGAEAIEINEKLEPAGLIPLSKRLFVSIGEKLYNQRKQLNLSTEDIEQFTSIKPHYLEALESGAIEKLPSIPQARGMLNNYATFLNLDIDQTMNQFAEALQTRRNESYAPHKIGADNQLAYQKPEIKKVGWLKFITTDLLLTSGLIIGLFIFILWGAANISGNKNDGNEIEPPSISDILLENTPEILETIISTEIVLQPTNTVSVEINAALPEGEGENETAPQLSGLPVQVYIIARQRAYLKVDVDGENVFTGRTIPGNAYEFSGSSSVELLTGNAAALEIYYNLNPIGLIGEVGEVKSIVFNSSTGIITPTPRFTPLPSQTAQPSATLQPSSTPTIPPPTRTPTVTQLIP